MKKLSVLLLLLTFLVVGCAQAEQTAQYPTPEVTNVSQPDIPDATRPNFVVIMTDDQHINTLQFMPILQEELLANGMQFTRAYVTTPLCCPSRSSFLLGQYMHNHQVFSNRPEALGGFPRFRDLGHENNTLAIALDNVGYRTGLIGKYLTSYPDNTPYHVPVGWDEWYGWSNGNSINQEALELDFIVDTSQDSAYYNYFINHNGTPVMIGDNENDYLTDYVSREAVIFLENTPQDQPFFLFLSPYAPHGPFTPAERHRGQYANVDISDVSPNTADEFGNYPNYLETLLAVDEMIGAVTHQLDEMGIRDNTYIMFMTDNGVDISEQGRDYGKGMYYETNILTPFVITGPNIEAGSTNDQPILNIDLAPTIVEFAGTTMPIQVDGQSIQPLLNSDVEAIDWRQNFLIQHYRVNGAWIGVRTPQYVYVRFYNDMEQGELDFTIEPDEILLYDIIADPQQLNNLVGAVSQEMLDTFFDYLQELHGCVGEECHAIEQQIIP